MYLDYYGFSEKPFSNTPSPRFLYESRPHREALARLLYAVEEKELGVLTGEIGSGKTTLTRALLDHLDSHRYHPMIIINPRLSPGQFLRAVARNLNLEPRYFRQDLLEQIHKRLFELYEEEVLPLLIVDEAQLIPRKATFDEIRLLTNFQLDDANLICIILVGQPELDRRLKHKAYRPLRQRIGVRFFLPPLSEADTIGYVKHRLNLAGGDPELFTLEALKTLHRLSKGIPRVINSLCNMALLAGMEKQAKIIMPSMIEEVAGELYLEEEDG